MKLNSAMKRKGNKNIKNIPIKILFIFLIMIFLIILIFSIYNIIKWKLDTNKTNNQINNISEDVIVETVPDTDNTEIVETETGDPYEDPYFKYIKMNMINVDFSELKKINSDVIGWVQVNGTNINYPFVQTSDNKYYLTRSFDKSYNQAGWVFLDYRNNITNNKNTILYAHSRINETMFGSLKNILSSGWLNNQDNYVVKISTESENTLWQVFSIYHIETTNDYIQTSFLDENDFNNFVNLIKTRSSYNFNTPINKNDSILTLSTCYGTSQRVVLHTKLIKREYK